MKIGKVVEPTQKGVTFVANVVRAITFLEVGMDRTKEYAIFQEQVILCTELQNDYIEIFDISPEEISNKWKAAGGSILHTHSILQAQTYFLSTVPPGNLLAGCQPTINSVWDENSNPANATTDTCMDDFFVRIFFQQWFEPALYGKHLEQIFHHCFKE